MRYLTEEQVLTLHRRVIEQSGGGDGMRDWGAFQSAVAQPQQSFGGTELYPTIETKATALLYSLVLNHPFVDGNKRIGHFACETFLLLNDYEIIAPVDEQEQRILDLAAGSISRDELEQWLTSRIQPLNN